MIKQRGAVAAFLLAFAVTNMVGRDCAAHAGERDIGLVLSGGGAKGAYEVGVWQAICEAGLDRRIGAMSGTSVGSICAVLFSSVGDTNRCESIWKEAMADAFEVNIGFILATALHNEQGLDKYANDNGLMSKEALRRVIDLNLSNWPPLAEISVYATTTEKRTMNKSYFRLNTLSKTNMLEHVIASCAIPIVYSAQTID